MIYFFTPYSKSRQIGQAYNHYCEMVPNNDDWICITDGDTCFLTPDYGTIIHESITSHGDSYELLTCYTNRIWTKSQRLRTYPGASRNRDIVYHQHIAKLLSQNPNEIIPVCKPISGFFLLFKKSTWLDFRFPFTSCEGSLLGIDYKWSQSLLDNGRRIGIISNLYIFHYYRLHGGGKKHLL